MKPRYQIFFAIPYDTATKEMYERIRVQLHEKFQNIVSVIGANEIKPSTDYSEIVSFKAQNLELNEQFKIQIHKSDIIIADLTHNNPNVHFELGIALTYNKNILRVTGRSLKEVGFDIQNLDIYQYNDENKLLEKIEKYLIMFFKIKNQTFEDIIDHRIYYKDLMEHVLSPKSDSQFIYTELFPKDGFPIKMRDGAVKVNFRINYTNPNDSANWFGVFFRAKVTPAFNGYLLYIRQNGSVELVSFTGSGDVPILNVFGILDNPEGIKTLYFTFDGSSLNVDIENVKNGNELYNNLQIQDIGKIYLAGYGASIYINHFELLSLDTIEHNS